MNKKLITIKDKYKYLKILPVIQLYKYKILLINYDNLKYFKKNLKAKELRNKNDYFIPTSKNKYSSKKSKIIIPKLLNKLPDIIKNINTYNKYKKDLKEWLINEIN